MLETVLDARMQSLTLEAIFDAGSNPQYRKRMSREHTFKTLLYQVRMHVSQTLLSRLVVSSQGKRRSWWKIEFSIDYVNALDVGSLLSVRNRQFVRGEGKQGVVISFSSMHPFFNLPCQRSKVGAEVEDLADVEKNLEWISLTECLCCNQCSRGCLSRIWLVLRKGAKVWRFCGST